MNQYTKRKLNEALELTQNDINKMPTDKLYDYVKIMTKEANRRRDIIMNNPKMGGNPIRKEVTERGKYTMPNEDESFLRQKLVSAYSKAYNLLTTRSSTLTGWGEIRKETRKRFIEKFKPQPDSDTGKLSEEAIKKYNKLKNFSYDKINEFWKLYNIVSEHPEVNKYVAGLDTNTLLHDVYEIAEDFNFKDLDKKIGSTLEKLLDEGILKRQYMEKQDEE